MKNRSMILSLILILFVFVLAGCKIENKNNVVPADMETSPAEYKNMSVEELHTQLENKDFFLNRSILLAQINSSRMIQYCKT